MSNYNPVVRTRTLARIVGPYLVILGAALFIRKDRLATLLPAFMRDTPLVFAAGAFTLMAGLSIVAAHHHWRGVAASVISLIGFVAALKGALLMIAPELGSELTALVVQAPVSLMIVADGVMLVGLWLVFVGWLSK